MHEDIRLSPLGAEMIAGLSAFHDALASGKPISNRFALRVITLKLQPKPTKIPQDGPTSDEIQRPV